MNNIIPFPQKAPHEPDVDALIIEARAALEMAAKTEGPARVVCLLRATTAAVSALQAAGISSGVIPPNLSQTGIDAAATAKSVAETIYARLTNMDRK